MFEAALSRLQVSRRICCNNSISPGGLSLLMMLHACAAKHVLCALVFRMCQWQMQRPTTSKTFWEAHCSRPCTSGCSRPVRSIFYPQVSWPRCCCTGIAHFSYDLSWNAGIHSDQQAGMSLRSQVDASCMCFAGHLWCGEIIVGELPPTLAMHGMCKHA